MKMNCLLFTLLLSMMVVMGRCEFTEQDDERIEGIIIDIMGKMKEQTQQCEFDEFYDSGCQSCEHVCNDPMNKDCHDVCPEYAAYKLAVYISDQRTQQEISKLRNEMEEQHKRNMIIIEIMGASIITIIIILILIAVVIKYHKQTTYTHNKHRQMEEGIKMGSLSTLSTSLSDMTDPDLSQETDQILPQPQITDQILRQEADQNIPQEREQILLQGSGSSVAHQENDTIVRQESSGFISEKTVPVQVQNDNVSTVNST